MKCIQEFIRDKKQKKKAMQEQIQSLVKLEFQEIEKDEDVQEYCPFTFFPFQQFLNSILESVSVDDGGVLLALLLRNKGSLLHAAPFWNVCNVFWSSEEEEDVDEKEAAPAPPRGRMSRYEDVLRTPKSRHLLPKTNPRKDPKLAAEFANDKDDDEPPQRKKRHAAASSLTLLDDEKGDGEHKQEEENDGEGQEEEAEKKKRPAPKRKREDDAHDDEEESRATKRKREGEPSVDDGEGWYPEDYYTFKAGEVIPPYIRKNFLPYARGWLPKCSVCGKNPMQLGSKKVKNKDGTARLRRKCYVCCKTQTKKREPKVQAHGQQQQVPQEVPQQEALQQAPEEAPQQHQEGFGDAPQHPFPAEQQQSQEQLFPLF